MAKNTNRTKGHNYEREWAKIYREVGYDKCKTSRQANRLLDDCMVDLTFIPYNHQCKSGYKKGLNYSSIFRVMKERLKDNFPEDDPVQKKPCVISHKRGRTKEEHLVVLEASVYIELITKIKEYEKILMKNDK